MNKKTKIAIIVIVLATAIDLAIAIWEIGTIVRRQIIINKGNEVFGTSDCSRGTKGDTKHFDIGGTVSFTHDCRICGRKMHATNTATDTICKSCQKITGRCGRCGGLNPLE